ncbi:TolC family protein [Seonamhaeicola marinus]|uniref:TolC family protein n=1 Tax=Seonamhaeicola marinus TaxID=1912246 RepID=A0A5D0HYK9_9FLAO|nr:TolC family protein [Seonamhaeicola marinus]TYA74572.1 TolC family protein [Seonamhaeicola marinus]
MRTLLFVALLVITGTQTFAQQKKWTLQECVNYAQENNISIKQSELNVQQGEINKKDAVGNFLPSFNASGSHSWNIGLNQNITTGLLENLTTQFTSFRLTSNVTIYNGLRNINQLHRANLAVLANQYQLSDMKDDISLMVANSFLQILFNKEQLKIQKAQYEVTNKNLKRTEELVEAGVLPKGDALEIKATLASQEQQIVNTENTLLLSKINLAQTLRIDDYQNFDTEDISYDVPLSSILKESPKTIVDKAKERRYDLKIADANVQLAEYDLKLAKGNLQPSLTGFYQYDSRATNNDRVVGVETVPDGTNSPIGFVEGTGETVLSPNFTTNRIIEGPDGIFNQFSRNDGHSFGVSLNVPIFNGFSARNNVARNTINLERIKNEYAQAELDLETEVYQAINDAKGALKAYEAALKTEEARMEAFNYAKERYNLGVSNSFDFSQSQSRYEQSQNEVIRTKYDYIFRLKVIQFYFGIPIDN